MTHRVGEIVAAWNHDDGREAVGMIVEIKQLHKPTRPDEVEFIVLIDGDVWNLSDDDIFSIGRARPNDPDVSVAKRFFSRQRKFGREDLLQKIHVSTSGWSNR